MIYWSINCEYETFQLGLVSYIHFTQPPLDISKLDVRLIFVSSSLVFIRNSYILIYLLR